MEEILTIDGRDFLVANRINYNNNNYIYVIAADESKDVTLLKEFSKEDSLYIESVTDEVEFKAVMEAIITNNL